ncbi:YgcG family protein [Salinicoccus sp. YB14-2]|uniref:TPM domain-containing protein n=1 Tax=Salinicoccus sp. YB14-2 TaxID=1572701 RepID=UPI00068C0BDA|nr:TPM domain-containing protein [Salinicoccus sp. YB14-2]
MKRLLLVFAAVFLTLSFSPDAFARTEIPEIDTNNYFVQDHADVLSPETTESLNDLGEHLEEGTGAEILLITMPTVGQEHRQDYALRVLREYGVGKEEHDNGIVIFLNLDNGNEFNNRGIDIQVGYGVEGYLNDAKIGRIIDDTAMENFQNAADADNENTRNAYYEEGLVNLYNAIYEESLDAYGFTDGEFTREEPADDELSLFNIITRILFMMAVIYVLYKLFSNNSGGPGGPGGRNRRTRRRRGGPVVLFPPSGGGGFGSGGGSGGFGGFGGGSGGGGGAGRGF